MKGLVLLLLLAFSMSPALAQTLKAGIQIDDGGFKENVLDNLQVGQLFNRASIPANPGMVFTELPPWLVGRWYSGETTTIKDGVTKTRTAISRSAFGGVRDKYGRPWMKVSIPGVSLTAFGDGDIGYCVSYPIRFLLNDDCSKYTQQLDTVNFITSAEGLVKFVKRERCTTSLNQFGNAVQGVQHEEGEDVVATYFMTKTEDVAARADDQQAFAIWARKVGRADLVP